MIRSHKISEIVNEIGKEVVLTGWVDTIRAHGKVMFIDLRDKYAKLQCVVVPSNKEAFEVAQKLGSEYCVKIIGIVKSRPKGSENKDMITGAVEFEIKSIEILNECKQLPFELDKKDVGEEVRLKYRFLDLRTAELQKNLLLRHKIIKSIRDFYDKEGFVEVETPMLGASTPEGARDYVVPSRNFEGSFYALPQSPQLYKQMLMVGGTDKYFQIAKCLRDEDLRADRQPEFTQLDVEMSFVDTEDVYDMVERTLKHVFKDTLNIELKIPFRRIPYDEAMSKYKSDKPDLRSETGEEFAFEWIVDFPLFEYSKEEARYVAAHHPFCMPNDLKLFENEPLKVKGKTYDLVLNGTEILSGSIRIHRPDIQRKVFDLLGLTPEEQEKKFGFFLNAFSYGAPPHGGFAIGLDRFIQILAKAPSIREVIAFPKNSEARDVMLDAPSPISSKQLKEVHVSIIETKKKQEKEK
ncbi:MAG: aspartate--tRNA ligase [Candidatus Nanoarchaeia archaeon]